MNADHDLGVRLRQALLQERARAQPLDGRRLQALVGDLCQGEQQALLPPLRHLVLSPVLLGEASRTPPLAEPRSRSRFQQELRGVFASPLCDRMEAVIDGLLALPMAPSSADPAFEAKPWPLPADPGAAPEPRAAPSPPETPVASWGEQDPSRQAFADRRSSRGGRSGWLRLLIAGLAGGLLGLVGLLLVPHSLRRSAAPEAVQPPVAPDATAPLASDAAGGASAGAVGPVAGADPAADGLAGPAGTTALPSTPTTPTGPGSSQPGAAANPAGANDGTVTPAAPELPQIAGPAPSATAGMEASTTAAIRTVEALYGALSRQDAAAARGFFAGEAADQFDPAFFRQFARVEVAALQPTATTATSVSLDGVVTFVYPDGSRQKERRSFTLDTRSDPPRVIASAFGAVLVPRGAAR